MDKEHENKNRSILNSQTIIISCVSLVIGGAIGYGISSINTVSVSTFNNLLDQYEQSIADSDKASSNNGSENNPKNSSTPTTAPVKDEYVASWVNDGTPFIVEIGTSKAEIKDVGICQLNDSRYVLTMNFLYTNSSDEAKNFINDYNVYVEPYQNGIELERPGTTSEDGFYDTNNAYKSIKQGASIDAQLAFVLEDTSSPIEVEIGHYSDYDKKIIKTINISKN